MDEYDRERPLPGPPPDRRPGPGPDPDPEWAEYAAWLDREFAAGRDPDPDPDPDPEPGDPAFESPAFGWRDPEDPAFEDLAFNDLDSGEPGVLFGAGEVADVLPPGPVLSVLTERAVAGVGGLSDDELIGVLQASRRLEAREAYKQALVIAEFGRRREAEFEDARRRGVPTGCLPGGFPGEELAAELVATRAEAGHRIEDAADLTARLPATLAGMAAGLIDAPRAGVIAFYTRSLTPADAARADEVLAAAAPGLRVDQLARRAAALELKLAPDAVKARREHARSTAQRVEARRELSGNASLAGREMGTADVMASKSYIDALAARLRNAGLHAPLGALRVLVMTDLTQGRNPLDRLRPPCPAGPAQPAPHPAADPDGPHPAAPHPVGPGEPGPQPAGPSAPHPVGSGEPGPRPAGPSAPQPADPAGPQAGPGQPPAPAGPGYAGPDGWPGWDDGEAETAYDDPLADELDDAARRAPVRPGGPVPLPALVNLLVPAGTILGWSAAPAQAGTWGLLDRDETRAAVAAAARHPRTRWCVTLLNGKGEATAHGCARGQRPGLLDGLLDGLGPQPPPDRLAELLRRLNITFEPIAAGTCDHRHAEDRYTPGRRLRHLIRARTATCDAPGCGAQALHCDLDHTVPYPDGPTDECGLGPRCRTHHRAKQAPDWKVQQTQPGVITWTLPSGRTHVTTPTTYDI